MVHLKKPETGVYRHKKKTFHWVNPRNSNPQIQIKIKGLGLAEPISARRGELLIHQCKEVELKRHGLQSRAWNSVKDSL